MRERPRRRRGREVARLAPEDEVREIHSRGRRAPPEVLVPARGKQPPAGDEARREHDEESGKESQDAPCGERQRRERAVGEAAPDGAPDRGAARDEEYLA